MMKNPPTETSSVSAPAATNAPPVAVKETPAPSQTTPSALKREPLDAGTAMLGIGLLFLILLASPFLAGFSNVIGWLIIAIGLYEAWKHTREVPFLAGGPYKIAPPQPSGPPDQHPQQVEDEESEST